MMIRCIILTILAVLISGPVWTQHRLDSLRQALTHAQSDADKSALCNEIAWNLKDRDPEEAMAQAETGIHLAEKAGAGETLALLHKTTGVIHWYRSDLVNAERHLLIALEKYRAINHREGIANVLNNLGLVAQASGKHATAIRYLEESAAIRELIGDKVGVANSCNNIGIMHFMAGEYEAALGRHLKALAIWDELNHFEGRAFSLMNIGRIHLQLRRPEEAMRHFNRAFDIHLFTENLRGQADAHSNIADVHLLKGMYAPALDRFFKSLALREQLGDKTGIRECLSKIGETELAQGQVQESLSHHLRALNMAEQIGEKQGMVLQYNHLGRAYTAAKQPEKALQHLFTGISIAEEIGAKHEQNIAHRLIADAYKALGQHHLALQHMEHFLDHQDSIFTQETAKSLIEMEAKYEAQHKQQEIEVLRQESTIASLQMTRLLILFIALILGGTSALLLYRYRYQARIANMLAQQKQEIESRNLALAISNADLEQFAYAVSHDLKQPLRTIGSFSSLIERRYNSLLDEDGHQFIHYITDGVSHMHLLLSDILTYSQVGGQDHVETIDLNMAVSNALQNLDHLIHTEQASVEVDALPIVMGHYSGMVRLFQNLIHNGIKFHGDALPHIRITYTHLVNDHLIAVTDNGLGIEKPYLKKIFVLFQRLHTQAEFPGTGIGLAICQKIVRQHGGAIWAESRPGAGSTFMIKLPKDHFAWTQA